MKFLLAILLMFSIQCTSTHKGQKKDSTEEMSQVVQTVLNYPKLYKYFHHKSPGRVPVVLSTNIVGENISAIRFSQPVLLKADEDITGPYLRFKTLKCESGNKKCKVLLEYPIEGVELSGSVVKRNDGSWVMENAKVEEI